MKLLFDHCPPSALIREAKHCLTWFLLYDILFNCNQYYVGELCQQEDRSSATPSSLNMAHSGLMS